MTAETISEDNDTENQDTDTRGEDRDHEDILFDYDMEDDEPESS